MYTPDDHKEHKEHFAIDGDEIIHYKPVGYDKDCYKIEAVMDKATFIEAYKKWILGDEDNGEND
jgi:hypothetical protein